jgi:hypothetical protein
MASCPPDLPFADMPFNVTVIDPGDTRLVYAGTTTARSGAVKAVTVG